jgi:hypothetical protein
LAAVAEEEAAVAHAWVERDLEEWAVAARDPRAVWAAWEAGDRCRRRGLRRDLPVFPTSVAAVGRHGQRMAAEAPDQASAHAQVVQPAFVRVEDLDLALAPAAVTRPRCGLPSAADSFRAAEAQESRDLARGAAHVPDSAEVARRRSAAAGPVARVPPSQFREQAAPRDPEFARAAELAPAVVRRLAPPDPALAEAVVLEPATLTTSSA